MKDKETKEEKTEKKIDLHVHTTASDGTLSPTQVVFEAKKQNASAIAITDHDTTAGIDEAIDEGLKANIEIIPGIEFSSRIPNTNLSDVHIIGLFLEHHNKNLQDFIKLISQSRISQKKEIVEKLQKLGYKITYKEVESIAQESIGRPHIAQILVKNNPEIKSVQDAFEKLIGNKKEAYVERKDKITVAQTIDVIHSAKGLAILAHPGVYDSDDKENLIKLFKQFGGDGIETIYPYNKASPFIGIDDEHLNRIINKYKDLAKKYNLAEAGGSDFHGFCKDIDICELNIPYSVLLNLRKFVEKNSSN